MNPFDTSDALAAHAQRPSGRAVRHLDTDGVPLPPPRGARPVARSREEVEAEYRKALLECSQALSRLLHVMSPNAGSVDPQLACRLAREARDEADRVLRGEAA